jgi:predicted phage baseplate assembly protein
MSLPVPQLDDRAFQDIVDEAKTRLKQLCPEWTDHNVSDPGVTLIELFAWMTELLLYRLNRVPEKQYIILMQLLGIKLEPARAAEAPITFQLTRPLTTADTDDLLIPEGTEVSTAPTADRCEVVTFTVMQDTPIRPPGKPFVYRQMSDTTTVSERQGSESFAMFGEPAGDNARTPLAGDCLYIGFPKQLSGHTLHLRLYFPEQPKASGHNQEQPPVVWEAWLGDNCWHAIAIESDTTGGLSNTGVIEMRLPLDMSTDAPPNLPGNPSLCCYLRCRYRPAEKNVYLQTPMLVDEGIGAATIGITVMVAHAALVSSEILGTSSGEPGQTFRLTNTPILKFNGTETIEVEKKASTSNAAEEWERWELPPAGDFHDSCGKNHVLIDYNAGELVFGPRIRERNGETKQYGNIPPQQCRIRVKRYRYGGGVGGNIPKETLTILKRTLPYVKPETCNYASATGGLDAETIAQAMQRAPRAIRTGDHAITRSDYEFFAKQADPRVAHAYCVEPDPATQDPTQARTVQVLIIPRAESPELKGIAKEQLALTDDLKRKVEAALEQRRMITTRIAVEAPRYIEVSVAVQRISAISAWFVPSQQPHQ